jgi:hypothetical protein
MFDSAMRIHLRTMIESSLSADAYRGNERGAATRVTYEAKRQEEGAELDELTELPCVSIKKWCPSLPVSSSVGGSGRSHGSDPGWQRLGCEIQRPRGGEFGQRPRHHLRADCSFDQTEVARL